MGLCASAQQKGDFGVGLNVGVAPCLESDASLTNFGLGAKLQYNITTPVRVEADLGYWFKAKGIEALDLSANLHYLFNAGERGRIYPLIGIGYARVKGSVDFDFDGQGYQVSASVNRFLLNIGLGAEYAVAPNVSIGAEVKYQYMEDFSRLPITMGITYRF